MVILWLLNLPTCLRHKILSSSSCGSKYGTFTGKKAARKVLVQNRQCCQTLQHRPPRDAVVTAHSCLPTTCTATHAAAGAKIIQTQARLEGICSALFGTVPNNYNSLKLIQLLPRISEQRGGERQYFNSIPISNKAPVLHGTFIK